MGGKSSTTTSKVSIPPEVLARYNAVNTRAETAASSPYEAFGKTASDYVAQMNAQQNAGISDINTTAGSYLPYMDKATSATQAGMGPAYEGIDNYMSPYIKNVADTTGAYMRQQQEQSQSGALGNAISSGAFGGDRAGIAAANLQQQNQMGYGKTMADILNQGYTQALGASQADLARQLQGGAQMAGLGAQSQQLGLQGAQAKIAAGTMQQQTEQAGKDAMINQFMQEKGYPFQTAQFLANIAMGTGAAQGSTTTTTTPKNWLGFASGGGVSGYADGGGVAGPRTYSQGQIGGQGYVPAGDLPVGQLMVADPPQQEQGNGMEDVVKLIAMMGGAKNGGAVENRHGYALDGGVEDPGNRIRLDDALIEQFGGVKPVVSDGKDGQMPSSRFVLGGGAQYPKSITLSPITTEQLRNRVNDPDYYDFSSFENARNLANARSQEKTNPANMGIGAGYNLGGNRAKVHPYPPSPTTGVVAPSPIAALQVTPEDDAARRAMMAKALGAREPRASERYMLPTGLVRPPVSALEELNLGAGDPFGAFTESARPPVVSEKPPTISSRSPASLTSPYGGKGGIRLPDVDVTSPILPSTPPRLGGLGAVDVAPPISQSPPPYPDGMSGADIAERAMATLGSPTQTSSLIDQKPAPLGANPSSGDMADTGLVPTGGYKPIIPLETQLQFVTSELQQPEYKAYLENTYATPAQAAVAFEQIYERANGAGNDVASAYATDVYKAALDGNLNDLPPNVAEAYNHFIQNDMDPIQAAGATGRLMVESYSHLDPNARNTLGGGYGTYGIAQHRGSRLEELAKFAGVPLQALIDAPVSTPEGRYYSHGADFKGGLGGADITAASGDGLGGADVTRQRGDPLRINKPYEDRNLIGQFFHDPTTGKLNPIAIKALISGLSGAAQAQTISPLGGILAGFGAGNATYNTLQNEEPKRVADIMENSKNARIQYLTEVAMGEERPFEQWAVSKYGSGPASMFGSPEGGAAVSQPTGKVDIMGSGLSQQIALPNGVVVQGGQNYAYLTKLANDLQPYVAAGVPAAINTAATVEARLTDIRNSKGFVQDINGNQVQDPTYTETLNEAARVDFGRTKTLEFQAAANERKQQLDQDLSEIKNQENVFTKFPAGALAKDKAAAFAIFGSLGVPVPADTEDYAAAAQEAVKNAARKVLTQVGTTAPSQEMQRLAVIVEDPNMQPEAIKMILSLQKAQASRQLAYYTLRSEWDAANPTKAMDQTAYDTWFAENHKFANYYEDAKKSMPIFAGELGSKQKPYKLSPEKDANGNYSQADADYKNLPIGSFFVDPNGLVKQKSGG